MGRQLVRSSGSSFSGACVPGSENAAIWLTLVTVGTCGLVRLHHGSASTAGATEVMAITACTLQTKTEGPFMLTNGAYIEGPCGTGASAFVGIMP